MVAGVVWARLALAVLAQPTARRVPRTMSPRVAMTAGVLRVRIVRASSPKTTSRIQWTEFSMVQWSRAQAAISAGVACSAGRSVTA